jgi:hypothetical protein
MSAAAGTPGNFWIGCRRGQLVLPAAYLLLVALILMPAVGLQGS